MQPLHPPLRVTVVLVTGVSFLACEDILGVDFDSARLGPKPAADAGTDAVSAEASTPDASSCDLFQPPTRPSDLPQATDLIEFTAVVRTVNFGETSANGAVDREIGYDLDGVCSPTCTPQPWVGVSAPDGPRGQDNAIAHLIAGQLDRFGLVAVSSELTNTGVAAGREAPLGVVRVRGYGGLSQDDDVEVDWFVAARPLRTGDGGTGAVDGGTPPAFTTRDEWSVLTTSVVNPAATSAAETDSVHRDPDAFVTRNTLVARFSSLAVPLRNVYFDLGRSVLTGELRRDPAGAWSIENATLSAEAATDDLLNVLPEIAQREFGVPLCTDDQANYPVVKRFICEAADLPAVDAPVGSDCLRTTVGVAFETSPASLGPIVPLDAFQTPCTSGNDPRDDTCTVEP